MTSSQRKSIAVRDRRKALRRHSLAMEPLEERAMLDAASIFDGAAYLTLSFAPDGTEAAGQASQLETKLNAIASEDQWQQSVLSAFQAWASHTNADIGLVDDQGLPFGIRGATTKDDRFGDIRIGAIPLDPQLTAVSVPHDRLIAGTWVGDVLLNQHVNIASLDDLYSIVLHEAGHVFGLDHSADVTSVMHAHGGGGITELNAIDIDNLIQLYGLRGEDAFDSGDDNDPMNETIANATRLQFPEASETDKGFAPSLVYGDITRQDDVDTFRFQPEDEYTGAVTFSLRVNGISQLQPVASVFLLDGTLVAAGQLDQEGWINLTIPAVSTDLYFQVSADSSVDPAARIGGYSLVVTMDDRLLTDAATIDSISDGRLRRIPSENLEKDLFNSDGSEATFIDAVDQDDSFLTATMLETVAGFKVGSHYSVSSSIQTEGDHDFFVFKSPEDDDVLNLHLRPKEENGLIPTVRLYDRNEEELNTTILANGDGHLIVQATGLEGDRDYFVEVLAANGSAPYATGNYELNVTSGVTPTVLQTISMGQLQPNAHRQQASLYVAQDQFFHFVLSNAAIGADGPLAVMRIIGTDGITIQQQLVAPTGSTRSGTTVRLGPGEYQVVVESLASVSNPLATSSFQLQAAIVSDPLAVPPDDPTGDPHYQCPGVTGEFCFPGGSQSNDPFFVSPFGPTVTFPPFGGLDPQQDDWWNSSDGSWIGDVNLDGNINSTDLGLQLNSFGDTSGLGWANGNLNGDANVDSLDLGLLLNGFGSTVLAASANVAAYATPATLRSAFDTNDDGRVTFDDARSVLGHLNRPNRIAPFPSEGPFDVDQNGTISPLDALLVINRVNSAVDINADRPVNAGSAIIHMRAMNIDTDDSDDESQRDDPFESSAVLAPATGPLRR